MTSPNSLHLQQDLSSSKLDIQNIYYNKDYEYHITPTDY